VANASTDTVYSVQNDYDQYWRTDSGYVVGGSWGAEPDPTWHHLEPVRL
jgi:hypothetical protein